MNWVPNLVDGIRQVDTPLKLLALIVVAFTITIGVVFSTGAELVQLLSVGALVLVVLASIAVVFIRANWSPDPTEPLLGADHLPLEYEHKHILLNGTWRCKWTARDLNGDLKDYSFETITIHDVDMSTGIIEGTGTNVYDGGAGYKIYGRISRRGYAHFYYTSPGRHAEKSGMVILKFDFQQQEAEGWWLGGLRGEGTPISGRVTWNEDANTEEWTDALCDFEYYPGVGPSEDRGDSSPEMPHT